MIDLTYLSFLFLQILNGLIMGLIYALMAVGVTLIFGVMKVVNFAHGEFYMLGGYVLYFAAMSLGGFSIPGIAFAFVATFVVGAIFELGILRPMFTQKMERPLEYSVIATFGLSIFLMNFALVVFGHHFKKPPDFLEGSVAISILNIGAGRIVGALVGVLTLLITLVLIKRTWLGRALQATSQNREAAAILGISVLNMNTLAFALGAGLAGVAGGILAPLFYCYSNVGELPGIKAYVITVLGGLGSIKGSLIGGVILGVVESLGSIFLSTAYRDVYSFAVLMAVLILRPTGLFGEKERRV